MRYLSTITPSDMRNINRTAIMKIIHTDGAVSRSAIAKKLGISLPSVVRIIDDLIDENLVRLTEDTEWSGGRRRPLVELNAENNLTIGIDMGGTKLYGAVADLGGKILYEKTLPKYNTTGEDSFVCVLI